MDVCDTRTTRTTGTTVSSAKRVRILSLLLPAFLGFVGCRILCVLTGTFVLTWVCWTVWVGPLVVKELKRIIESSEITK